jgi:hypothetical protein
VRRSAARHFVPALPLLLEHCDVLRVPSSAHYALCPECARLHLPTQNKQYRVQKAEAEAAFEKAIEIAQTTGIRLVSYRLVVGFGCCCSLHTTVLVCVRAARGGGGVCMRPAGGAHPYRMVIMLSRLAAGGGRWRC